jgi:hypothetical protein
VTWWETVGVAVCFVASAGGGLLVVPLVLRLADRKREGARSPEAVSSLRGGLWIGLLERLAITGSIAMGFEVGVGVVVAIKGLGRYPELKEHPVASERFVVGTLASFVWSALWGFLALALMS